MCVQSKERGRGGGGGGGRKEGWRDRGRGRGRGWNGGREEGPHLLLLVLSELLRVEVGVRVKQTASPSVVLQRDL